MTEKLFEKYPDMSFCDATVLSCTETEQGFEAVLDKTVLFPEGGGQLCDRGTVNGAEVLSVSESDGEIIHLLSEKVEPGSTVKVCLDEGYRLDNSQQHTGEHMLSFAFYKLFGAKNVGFHMNERAITIDLDTELTPEQVRMAENYANGEIWQDKSVDILYRMDDDLGDIPMRKVTEKVKGLLRVVVIPGGDACTCCGTHVSSTGKVGLIKVLKSERHRGGMRIEAACGRRALQALQSDRDVVSELMGILSTDESSIVQSVSNLKNDLRQSAMQLGRTGAKLMDYMAAEAAENAPEKNGVKVICAAAEVSPNEAKQLLTRLLGETGRIGAVIYPMEERIGYMVGRSEGVSLSCREVSSLINGIFNAKGGGRDELCQGSGKKTKDWKELTNMLSDSILRMI